MAAFEVRCTNARGTPPEGVRRRLQHELGFNIGFDTCCGLDSCSMRAKIIRLQSLFYGTSAGWTIRAFFSVHSS